MLYAPEGSQTPKLSDLHRDALSNKAFVLRAPEGSRTPNLLIRSQVLYPIKLQVLFNNLNMKPEGS